MERIFEASVLLLDTCGTTHFAKQVREEFVVAVPARDVLAFGDSSSAEAIAELNAITGRVHANGRGSHLLSPRLYRRSGECGLNMTVLSDTRTGRPESVVALVGGF
jgi:uncharacterized protein YtpQ (UPF0354 family)